MTPVRLARIVTCFRQWPLIRHWLVQPALFSDGIEWIVVNDCPRDPCPEAMRAQLAAHAIRLIAPRHNLGRAEARNCGARLAAAEWIEFIDGDDLPLPVDLGDLPPAAEVDVLQFPAPSVTLPVTAIGDWKPPEEPLEHVENWSPILPRLRPFDVRLTATMWSREFFLSTGGFDGRFEGIEDVHLAFKADQRGARSLRRARPKQLYCRRPLRETLERPRIEGAARFFRWIRAQHPDLAPRIVDGWLAKEDLYLGIRGGVDSLRHGRGWLSYLRWRLFS